MGVMTVTEARAALPELLTRVDGGEEVTITRHGRAVAVLVRPDALRIRHAGAAYGIADRVRDLLSAASAEPVPPSAGIAAERADELIRAIRADREAR